jgi:CubicO group peptidase (beta-lactamase class C family)
MTALSAAVRRIRRVVRDRIGAALATGVFPGAVVAIARREQTVYLEAFGHAQVVPRRRPATVRTVYDLASLTKPLAAATAVLQLWEQGRIDLDAPVAAYLPAFSAGGKASATVRHLLTHTSGLPAWEMLYLPAPSGVATTSLGTPRVRACRSVPDAVSRICATPASVPPGTKVEYSDLGFIVLGFLVERLAGEPLDHYAARHIFGPLGMTATRYRPPASWRSRCAATEVGNAYERAKAAAQGAGRRFAWRTAVLRGEVHDGNAWYVGRGVAGHAGLFGTAADLARFGLLILQGGTLDGTRILTAPTLQEATRNQTRGVDGEPRGLGWALKGCPFVGTAASARAFGHTGFTGTSWLADPERDLVVVLLSNRVHPRADSEAIRPFRPAFHDAVIEAWDGP